MHTPGPHLPITDFASGVYWIETEDGLCLAQVFGSDSDERLSGECEGNARLFAAALDLLAACEAFLAEVDDDSDPTPGTIWLARAAVARARVLTCQN